MLYQTAAPRQGEVLALNIADLGPGAPAYAKPTFDAVAGATAALDPDRRR